VCGFPAEQKWGGALARGRPPGRHLSARGRGRARVLLRGWSRDRVCYRAATV